MKRSDRLRELQKRYAMMQLSRVQPPVSSPGGATVTIGNSPVQLPPIRIELAVKAQNDPNQEQRVVNRTSPFPG